MLQNGLDRCPCVRKRCERYGKCAECIEYHTTKSKKYPEPYCKRERKVKKASLQPPLEK
ncbi:MAG: hypothetical protein GXY05_11845 [Clostridiales bacterium]|nr:hypothetical protein [Clostridiales bacterium]